jgi:IS30 family transposase
LANRMKTKDKGGRPGHGPDDRSRQMVEVLSGFGIPQDKIADVIGVDGKTLRRHYAREVQRGAATVEAKLARRKPAQARRRQRRNSAQGDHVRPAMPVRMVALCAASA